MEHNKTNIDIKPAQALPFPADCDQNVTRPITTPVTAPIAIITPPFIGDLEKQL